MLFQFTPKEQAVLDGLMEGLEPKTIAKEMGLKRRSIKGYIRKLCRKLEIPTMGAYIPHVRIVYVYARHLKLLPEFGWAD